MTARGLILPLALAGLLAAQQTSRQSQSSTTDPSGRSVFDSISSMTQAATGGGSRTVVRNLNGREVPLESTEERVLSQDSTTKVIERIVRRHDADGRPGPPEVQRIEERKQPDGGTQVSTTIYRSDVSGNRELAERSVATVRKSGSTSETNVTVERPSLSGALETVERMAALERETAPGAKRIESSVYRRDATGALREALRELTTLSKTGSQEAKDTIKYSLGPDNKLEVSERILGKTTKSADGSESEEIDVYSRFAAFHTADLNAKEPRLQEQITRERKPGPGSTFVETTTVRGRLPGDQSRMGVVEQTKATIHVATAGGVVTSTSDVTVSRIGPDGRLTAQERRRDVETRPEPKPEAKPEPKAEAKPAAKPEAKTAAKK